MKRVIMTKLMEWCWFREVRLGHNYSRCEHAGPAGGPVPHTDTGLHIMRVLIPSPSSSSHIALSRCFIIKTSRGRSEVCSSGKPIVVFQAPLHSNGEWVELIYSVINQNREKIISLAGPEQN